MLTLLTNIQLRAAKRRLEALSTIELVDVVEDVPLPSTLLSQVDFAAQVATMPPNAVLHDVGVDCSWLHSHLMSTSNDKKAWTCDCCKKDQPTSPLRRLHCHEGELLGFVSVCDLRYYRLQLRLVLQVHGITARPCSPTRAAPRPSAYAEETCWHVGEGPKSCDVRLLHEHGCSKIGSKLLLDLRRVGMPIRVL